MTQHSPELKAAVLAALLAGQQMAEVARKFNLPRCTVFRWRDEAHKIVAKQGETSPAADYLAQQQARCRALAADLLEVLLASARAQAQVHGTREWLREQRAEGAAQLLGSTFDGIFRVAEALEPDADSGLDAAAGSADEGDQGSP